MEKSVSSKQETYTSEIKPVICTCVKKGTKDEFKKIGRSWNVTYLPAIQ